MRIMPCKVLPSALFSTLALALAGAAGAQTAYEPPRQFKAEEFAPAVLLKGPLHSVDEVVSVDSGLPRFTVRSRYGIWEALGLEMLDIRVAELPAFEQLDKVSKSDEFAKAAGQAITKPVEMVGTFVQNPIDTTGSILTGIGTFANRVGRMVSSALTAVGDSVSAPAPVADCCRKRRRRGGLCSPAVAPVPSPGSTEVAFLYAHVFVYVLTTRRTSPTRGPHRIWK